MDRPGTTIGQQCRLVRISPHASQYGSTRATMFDVATASRLPPHSSGRAEVAAAMPSIAVRAAGSGFSRIRPPRKLPGSI